MTRHVQHKFVQIDPGYGNAFLGKKLFSFSLRCFCWRDNECHRFETRRKREADSDVMNSTKHEPFNRWGNRKRNRLNGVDRWVNRKRVRHGAVLNKRRSARRTRLTYLHGAHRVEWGTHVGKKTRADDEQGIENLGPK